MGKVMYVNFKEGEQRQFAGDTVKPLDSAVIPVEMLFNENSTAGEVRPLASARPRLRHSDGSVKPFEVERGENLVLGHEDLSEKGALMLSRPTPDAWTMPAEERQKYVGMVLDEGEIDEDTMSEIRERCDMFGMESLRENEQVLIGMDEDKLYDVQDFMHEAGMLEPGFNPDDYTSYGMTDTGRYIQIELKDQPGVLRNVYEAPPSGDTHQFWDMEPGEGKVNFMSVKEGDFELKGVYVGKPFQAERDEAAAILSGMHRQMAKPAGPFDRLMGRVDAMDAEAAGPEDGGHGVV